MIIEGYEVEKRQNWYADDSYVMSYEKIDHEIYIHIVVSKFSKKILADIKQKWNDFKLRAYMLGYQNIFTYTRDMRIINLVEKGDIIGHWKNNKVVRWELK